MAVNIHGLDRQEPSPVAALADIRAALRSRTAVEPPAPWRSGRIWIGGITAVGFAPGTDLSHNGLGVVDPFIADGGPQRRR
ncbi:hypothetical protein [Actinoplanes sp. NPDC026623]|uniref:hypothetical protein n=1 Tax=Actinoplanes sp. NPDC026623 TaxID=3155610 RepID=UPI0033D52769